jgi:hypothetical protein
LTQSAKVRWIKLVAQTSSPPLNSSEVVCTIHAGVCATCTRGCVQYPRECVCNMHERLCAISTRMCMQHAREIVCNMHENVYATCTRDCVQYPRALLRVLARWTAASGPVPFPAAALFGRKLQAPPALVPISRQRTTGNIHRRQHPPSDL